MEYIQIASERLRRSLPQVFAQVEGGGKRFEVTSHGRPVARIVPVDPSPLQAKRSDSGSLPADEIMDLPLDAD